MWRCSAANSLSLRLSPIAPPLFFFIYIPTSGAAGAPCTWQCNETGTVAPGCLVHCNERVNHHVNHFHSRRNYRRRFRLPLQVQRQFCARGVGRGVWGVARIFRIFNKFSEISKKRKSGQRVSWKVSSKFHSETKGKVSVRKFPFPSPGVLPRRPLEQNSPISAPGQFC